MQISFIVFICKDKSSWVWGEEFSANFHFNNNNKKYFFWSVLQGCLTNWGTIQCSSFSQLIHSLFIMQGWNPFCRGWFIQQGLILPHPTPNDFGLAEVSPLFEQLFWAVGCDARPAEPLLSRAAGNHIFIPRRVVFFFFPPQLFISEHHQPLLTLLDFFFFFWSATAFADVWITPQRAGVAAGIREELPNEVQGDVD